MAASPAYASASCAGPDEYWLPPQPSGLLRVHTWPQGRKDANLRTPALDIASSSWHSSSSAGFLSLFHPQDPDMAFSNSAGNHDTPPESCNSGCLVAEPVDHVAALSCASFDDVQDASSSSVNDAIVHHKGRKDVYLCYKEAHTWLPNHNNVLSPHLPFVLKNAIVSRQKEMPSKIRLMVCEGRHMDSNTEVGDVIIFPEMVKYKLVEDKECVVANICTSKGGLTASEIENFVEDVLIHEKGWIPRKQEKIRGIYVFVQPLSSVSSIFNGSNITFNGLDGAFLPEIIKNEAMSRGLDGDYIVIPSLQIHGHKHHGNVIVYSPDVNGSYTESCWSSLICYESDVAMFIGMFSSNTKTIEDVLKRHVEKAQDSSKNKDWMRRGFAFLKTPYAVATLASLSVGVVIGTIIAFQLSKKVE